MLYLSSKIQCSTLQTFISKPKPLMTKIHPTKAMNIESLTFIV
jgi:hypothetical protein